MTIDNFVRFATTAISIAAVFYIPKSKYRLAIISFITAQAITWGSSLIFVQIGWIEYPVREFARATRAGFIHHFVVLPILYTWFILLFPQKASLLKRLMHYIVFVSLAAWFVYFMCVYTNLVKFTQISFALQFILLYLRFFIYFIIMRIYILWFSKKTDLSGGG